MSHTPSPAPSSSLSRLRRAPTRAAGAALLLVLAACSAPAPSAGTGSQASPAAGGAAAASPSTAPASASSVPGAAASASPANAQAEWDRVLAAARQEGTVVVDMNPGTLYGDWARKFEQDYPGIKLDMTQLIGPDFDARILKEREAGQYLWDIYEGGSDSAYSNLVPADALDPLQPAVILPENLDDSKWLGGFAGGFVDAGGKYVYDVEGDVIPTVYINRDEVPESQLSRVEDLTDPKWKGKMSLYDPRAAGNGSATLAHWLLVMGNDTWVRQLMGQQPVITLDRRQQIEWVVTGQYPIALAGSNTVLPEFTSQGLGLNVKQLGFDTDMGRRLNYSASIGLINRAPHPNAAKVFINWLLSQKGQQEYVQILQSSSRRLDVPEGAPGTKPDPSINYRPSVNQETNSHFQKDAQAIGKETLQ